MIPKIQEADRRSDGFRADVPITLMDGQVWYLPRPMVRLQATRDESGVVGMKKSSSLGPEYLDKVEAYYRSTEDDSAGSMDRFAAAALDLSIALLLVNYHLGFEEAAALFWFDFSSEPEPHADRVRETFLTTALGLAKKNPSPVGSGST